MPEISAAISCNLDANILLAAVPLLESEKIEALEWSFDTLFKTAVFPDWFNELLHTFAYENRLIGHGVFWIEIDTFAVVKTSFDFNSIPSWDLGTAI